MRRTFPINLLRTLVCVTVLSAVASAPAASLMLDFGPTTIAGSDGTNSPAHSLGFVPMGETSWNKITVDNSSLVYSDGSTATGVAVVLGRTDAGVTNTVNFNNKLINSTGLTGSGAGLNSGVYAGTSALRDGIFATGTSSIATNALGMRVDGLPAGEYTVYFAARNSNIGSSMTEQVFVTNATSTASYTFTSSPSVFQLNAYSGGPTLTFALGDNYNKMVITLGTGESLYVACVGTNATEKRGFLNFVQIVPVTDTPPLVLAPPSPLSLYAGRTARFNVTASGTEPLTYRWRKDGSPLSDGGNISGATSTNLVLASISTVDIGDYDVVITNIANSVTSVVAHLEVLTATEDYETAVLAANPLAYYGFNETQDSLTGATVFDHAGGFNGTYGLAVLNSFYGISGPVPSGSFPGFAEPNGAAQFANGFANSRVIVQPWGLTTNALTITAWINPTDGQGSLRGLVFCRGTNVAGLSYSSSTNADGNFTLGYRWNDEPATFNWNSGLTAPPGQWSLVALVVTPTNVSLYVINPTTLLSAARDYTHVPQTFSGTTVIGNESNNYTTRGFNGMMDDVAVFAGALSKEQILALFTAGSGVADFPPVIATQPAATTLYEQQTAQFTVVAGGTAPLHYQWQKFTGGNYVNLADGGRITGVNSATLSISNLNLSDATDYRLTVTNQFNSINSSPATLTVLATLPPINYTMSAIQPLDAHWDSAGYWTPDETATFSSISRPGSTYELLPGCQMRTPNIVTAVFPGDLLTVGGGGTNRAVIAFKAATNYFKKIILDGGQISSFRDGTGNGVFTGTEIEVRAGSRITAGNGVLSGKAVRIEAPLTGNGSILCQMVTGTDYLPNVVGGLNIASPSNTYSGTWDVVAGVLLATAPNALGTNNITVQSGGALQPTYDVSSPAATLVLDGRLYLMAHHTFKAVTVGGASLAAGTYPFATLNSSYPLNFPATWVGQTGAETLTNASGSLTVLAGTASYSTNLTSAFSSGSLTLSWPASHAGWILQAQTNSSAVGLSTNWVDVPGSDAVTETNLAVNPENPAVFYRLRHP
jgi:Concanavalin A-like lectin/glucanases superfamily/Immunoglobulin I-set domain/Immunoglobulin domain